MLLAVSGGPDSTVLMHAAAALPRLRPIHVATVDHGLRPEAAAEARQVAHAAASLGLSHATLRWAGTDRPGAIQAQARAARYRLLAGHARAVGARVVLTGHTRDDQAETVLMRLIAGSGPAGLAGIRSERDLARGIVLGRPFLTLPKADLVAWCEARGIPFVLDPSNDEDRFARVRLRRLLPLLEREGLTTERLVTLAERAARDAAAIEAAAELALNAAIRPPSRASGEIARRVPPAEGGDGAGDGSEANDLVLHGPDIAGVPDAVALRLVDLALDRAGGRRPRRLERLERLVLGDLLPALRAGRPVRRTLRGLAVAADAAGAVTIRAAPPRRTGGLAAATSALLGKGEGSAYIGPACADGPADAGTRPARPRD